jgi:nuclear pore complex protein Nup133
VEVCLSSGKKDLILRAFDVFAWGGDVFRRCNKSLLEHAWLTAASQDDWVMMRQVSERDGWSDDQYLEALQNTALYLASKRCYGEYSECLGGTFGELLPLLHEEIEQELDFPSKETDKPSVETTLMQHPDYAEAGEAMVAALRMGKCTVEVYERDLNDVMEV